MIEFLWIIIIFIPLTTNGVKRRLPYIFIAYKKFNIHIQNNDGRMNKYTRFLGKMGTELKKTWMNRYQDITKILVNISGLHTKQKLFIFFGV